jgi:hypothetical protein
MPMQAIRGFMLIFVTATGACSAPGGPYPSLQPRAAEAIDPRIPVEEPRNDRPVSPGLASRLAELIAHARNGDTDFQVAADQAERLTASAGTPQSETWVAAQEALTVAVAARGAVGSALGDIDETAAVALQTQGGIAPSDLAAIQHASAEVGTINQREAARTQAIQDRLHL